MIPGAFRMLRPDHSGRGHGRGRCDQARACGEGPTSTKIDFLLKNAILDLFWPFWGLLDVKNGSGSKFCTRKWYREVQKSKFKHFRDESLIHWGRTVGTLGSDESNLTPWGGWRPSLITWAGYDPSVACS